MKMYRIQHKETKDGMWRGIVIVDGKIVVDHLTDKKLANMPMPDSPVYRRDGKVWRSAVNNKESMFFWFTKQEIEEMVALGMTVISFDCDDWFEVEHKEILCYEGDMRNIQDVTEEFLTHKVVNTDTVHDHFKAEDVLNKK
jgi:hypothetical protein